MQNEELQECLRVLLAGKSVTQAQLERIISDHMPGARLRRLGPWYTIFNTRLCLQATTPRQLAEMLLEMITGRGRPVAKTCSGNQSECLDGHIDACK